MSTEAPEDSAPEVLAVGPEPPRTSLRRVLLTLVLVGAMVLAGIGVWRLLPERPPTFGLSDLEDVYAGMVRSDGTNDASVMLRENASDVAGIVAPAECLPLFDSTTFNHFPNDALDGVGTYWLGGTGAISLFTLRFDDTSVAEQAYRQVGDALESCAGREVMISDKKPWTGRVTRAETTADNGVRDQVAYAFDRSTKARFAVHAFLLGNTVTWQFRYETVNGDYSSVAGQRLMDSMVSQMRAVHELRNGQPR